MQGTFVRPRDTKHQAVPGCLPNAWQRQFLLSRQERGEEDPGKKQDPTGT